MSLSHASEDPLAVALAVGAHRPLVRNGIVHFEQADAAAAASVEEPVALDDAYFEPAK